MKFLVTIGLMTKEPFQGFFLQVHWLVLHPPHTSDNSCLKIKVLVAVVTWVKPNNLDYKDKLIPKASMKQIETVLIDMTHAAPH